MLLRSMNRPTRVLLSYSRYDEPFLDALLKHLVHLERRHSVEFWYERQIGGGEDRPSRLAGFFDRADVIVALISADFLASDEIDVYLRRAIQREGPKARLIPIPVRPVSWQTSLFQPFQPLPKNGKPVIAWADHDEAWVEVAHGIERAVEEERARRDLDEQNQRLRDELAQASEVARRHEAERSKLRSLVEELQRERDRMVAEEGKRIEHANRQLISDLRKTEDQNVALMGRVEFLTRQLATLTQNLGMAESARTDDARTIKELQQQRQQDRNEIRRLKEALNQKTELLQAIENRPFVRANIVPERARSNASRAGVIWPFHVENVGQGALRLVRVELNWVLASTVDGPSVGRVALLPTWESREFRPPPIIQVGAVSDSFEIQFEPDSSEAQTLSLHHTALFPDRTLAGWSNAIRPVVRLLVEGQDVKHREVVELAFR